MKTDTKEMLQTLVLGTGVVVLTPILSGLVAGVAILGTSILGLITIGGALAAGVSAFLVQWAIKSWWK